MRTIDIRATISGVTNVSLRILVDDEMVIGPNHTDAESGDRLTRWIGDEDAEEGDTIQVVNVIAANGCTASYILHEGSLHRMLPCYNLWPELDSIVQTAINAEGL